jgi:hypothetical protein
VSQPNQFTRAEEQGIPKPAGATVHYRQAELSTTSQTKDKMRAEHLARRLYNFAKAKGDKAKKLTHGLQTQVAAARF